ncbi:MAG TPA: reverse transcriptase-like protein [Anaerolineae bacterium]
MSASRVDQVLEAIASLSQEERRELFSRLGIFLSPRPTQPALLGEFSPNTLTGTADYAVVFDGGSEGNPGRGYGSYAINGEVKRVTFGDDMTNNEAEYATLLHALDDVMGRIERASTLPEAFSIEVRGDSALVLNQVSGEWKAKDDRMRMLRDSARRSLRRFKANRLALQPRSETVRLLGH